MDNKNKYLIEVSLSIALLAVGGFIKIPFAILPITLQPFFLYTIIFTFGRKKSVAATSMYLILGLMGIPIFANGGGIGYLLQPSFGFLIGFVVVSFIAGTILKITDKEDVKTYIIVGCISEVFLYIVGVSYMFVILNFYLNIEKTIPVLVVSYVLPYLPSDILSIVIGAVISNRVKSQYSK